MQPIKWNLDNRTAKWKNYSKGAIELTYTQNIPLRWPMKNYSPVLFSLWLQVFQKFCLLIIKLCKVLLQQFCIITRKLQFSKFTFVNFLLCRWLSANSPQFSSGLFTATLCQGCFILWMFHPKNSKVLCMKFDAYFSIWQ